MEPDSRYRTLRAVGMGAESVSELIVSSLGDRPGLTVREVAPGRISVARTRRPRWAVIACACTFWLGGLGFLFLLVRQTEAGEITVSDGPQGCVVVLPSVLVGPVGEQLAAELRDPFGTAAGGSERAGRRRSTGPELAADDGAVDGLDERTVVRRDLPPPPASPVPPMPGPAVPPDPTGPTQSSQRSAGPVLVLRFDAGTLSVRAGEQVILGREPSGGQAHRVEVVPGDASTVSKAHLLVSFDGSVATVEDLGSTNGSVLLRGEDQRPLEPNVATSVRPGDRVELGSVGCSVELVPGE